MYSLIVKHHVGKEQREEIPNRDLQRCGNLYLVFEYIEHDLGNYQLLLKSWKQSEWKSQKIGIILTQGEVERMRKSE